MNVVALKPGMQEVKQDHAQSGEGAACKMETAFEEMATRGQPLVKNGRVIEL